MLYVAHPHVPELRLQESCSRFLAERVLDGKAVFLPTPPGFSTDDVTCDDKSELYDRNNPSMEPTVNEASGKA